MLGILFKKQMSELNQSFFQDRKKGKRRSAVSTAALVLLYLSLLVCLGGIFFYVGKVLCQPLLQAGIGWLYFTIMGMIALALGIFGSIFNTFASLYQAKDNDLLLSLPIPIRAILLVRLSGVYVMGLLYGSIVTIPAIIVYVMTAGAGAVLGGIVWLFLISLCNLILSCILGWVVAKINSRLRNKSLLTVVVSLAFLGGYYYVWFQANHLLQMLIINSMTVGAKIKGAVYPLYLSGRVGEGDIVSALLCAAVLFAAAALVYRILSYNFVKMTASSSGKQHTRYREKRLRRKSCMGALLTREVRRFLSSSTYMLNCSLGTLFLVAASVFLLVKGNWILGALWQFFEADMKMVFLIGCVGVCGLAAMNDITAPSVSLEGKNLWILQSLPIASWDVLKVKLYLHLLLTGIPAILCTVCMAVVFRFSLLMASAAILMVFLFTLLSAETGLWMNLKMPNLNWKSETAVVKQSISVFLVLLLNLVYAFAIMGVYVITGEPLGAELYIFGCCLLTAVLCFWIFYWLKTRGTKILENL